MKIVLTPDWFLGKDVMIEGFSFLVLLAFFILCWRYYKLNKKKNFLYLGIGFLLIAVGQLANIFTKLVLYYDTTFTQKIGQLIVTYKFVESVNILYNAGFFFNRLLTLVGLFLIYRISCEKRTIEDFLLTTYFIVISVFFSIQEYYLFHLTVLILLALIIKNYWKIYSQNKNKNTKILLIAFIILAFANVISIFSKVGFLCVLGNLVELVSYLILLFLIVRILRSSKKKSK